ncbi:MAG: DUF11 domain-containing protein [Dysgonamonadaceae bacterium]|jgi:uncharacterized repeat protein (TIGR01451 family)|nr:DUF11 domain-containing protein [Dysgonamonadaceae bacterium]
MNTIELKRIVFAGLVFYALLTTSVATAQTVNDRNPVCNGPDLYTQISSNIFEYDGRTHYYFPFTNTGTVEAPANTPFTIYKDTIAPENIVYSGTLGSAAIPISPKRIFYVPFSLYINQSGLLPGYIRIGDDGVNFPAKGFSDCNLADNTYLISNSDINIRIIDGKMGTHHAICAGKDIVFTYNIKNNPPLVAKNVIVTDTLGPGMDFVTIDVQNEANISTYDPATRSFTIEIPEIKGFSCFIKITAHSTVPGTYWNTIKINSVEDADVPVDYNAMSTYVVVAPDIVPAPPVIATSDPLLYCNEAIINTTFQATANNVDYQLYQWYKDGEAIDTATSCAYTATVPGIYTATVDNGCRTSSFSNSLEITAARFPDNPPIVTPPGPVDRLYNQEMTVLTPKTVTLSASGNGGQDAYQWYRDGILIEGATQDTYEAVLRGQYSVKQYDRTTGCWSEESKQTLVTESVPRIYWRSDARSSNWNDITNWYHSPISVRVVGFVPGAHSDVFIPGNALYFPSLDSVNTPRERDGVPRCNTITFGFGAELAQPHYLQYNKAYVYYGSQYYNDDYSVIYDDGKSSPDDKTAFASPSMLRGQWYALAAPLKKIVTGDFSFGGFPYTWQQQFKSTRVTYNDTPILTGGWYPTDPNLALEIGPRANYAICLYIPKYNSSVLGVSDQKHLQNLTGGIKMPYFEDPFAGPEHPAHTYANGISKIHYYSGEPGFPLIDDMYDEIARGDESYRFIFEDDNNQPQDPFTIMLPVTDNDQDKKIDEVMVGNPFISSLDIAKLYEANSDKIESYYRVYSNGSFETNPLTQADTIATLQAFFVRPIGTVGEEVALTFTKEMSISRGNGTPGNAGSHLQRASKAIDKKQQGVIRLTVANASGSNYTTFVFHREGTKDVDWMLYDAYKPALDDKNSDMTTPWVPDLPDVPQIYSLDYINDKCAIQYVAVNGMSSEIPLGIRVRGNAQGSYKILFESTGDLNPKAIFLLDKLTGKKVSPVDTDVYEFMVDAGYDPNHLDNRFALLIGKQIFNDNDDLGLNIRPETDEIYVYADGRRLQVTSTGENISDITVTDIQGIRIAAEHDIRQSTYSLQLPSVAQGIYLVSVKLTNGTTKVKKLKVEG